MNARYFLANSAERLRWVASEIARLPASPARPLEVVVRQVRPRKTAEQRGLWHALLREMAAATGYTPGQMKEVVKREYYGPEWIRFPDGGEREITPSSEAEDREGYSRLIEFTVAFAHEHGIDVTDPGT